MTNPMNKLVQMNSENIRAEDRKFLDYAINLAQELEVEGNPNLASDVKKLVCISRYYLAKDAITILREVA